MAGDFSLCRLQEMPEANVIEHLMMLVNGGPVSTNTVLKQSQDFLKHHIVVHFFLTESRPKKMICHVSFFS